MPEREQQGPMGSLDVDRLRFKAKPKFKHDCAHPHCVFLGTYDDTDLYFHKASIETTIVARFGDDGPDYTSGICFGRERELFRQEYEGTRMINHTRVAWLLAVDAGLLPADKEW